MFKVRIKTDNAAFGEDEDARSLELARIFRKLAEDLEGRGMRAYALHDYNGNTVGIAEEEE